MKPRPPLPPGPWLVVGLARSGLAAGEWVVATGANKLYEGQRVRPYEAAGRPAPAVASSASG